MDKVNKPDSTLKLRLDTVVTAIEGKDRVEKVILKDVKTNKQEDFPCDGVFIFVGMIPNTAFLKGFVELTEVGFVKCDTGFLRTNIPGVFAAGDCRVAASMQLATAVGDGVTAAMAMKQYFRDAKWWNEPVSDSLQPGGW
jgi:thioredoxin reductase (NADPH)